MEESGLRDGPTQESMGEQVVTRQAALQPLKGGRTSRNENRVGTVLQLRLEGRVGQPDR